MIALYWLVIWLDVYFIHLSIQPLNSLSLDDVNCSFLSTSVVVLATSRLQEYFNPLTFHKNQNPITRLLFNISIQCFSIPSQLLPPSSLSSVLDQHHKIHLILILEYLPGMTPVRNGPYADAKIILFLQALPLIITTACWLIQQEYRPSPSAALLASRRYQGITRSEFGHLRQFLAMYAYHHAAVTRLAKRCRMRSSISYAVTIATTWRMII